MPPLTRPPPRALAPQRAPGAAPIPRPRAAPPPRRPPPLPARTQAPPPPRSVPEGKQQTTVVASSAAAHTYDALADRALTLLRALPPGSRLVIGLAGPPGAGKSTLSAAVVKRLNAALASPTAAAVLPMDGFHLTKAQLAAFPDPDAAFARRGAPHTFDAAAFVAAVQTAAVPGSAHALPSFDHGVGDPTPGGVVVGGDAVALIVEGNYLLLPSPPWRDLRPVFHETWYIDLPVDMAMARLASRQARDGVPPPVSRERIKTNDRPNAELVREASAGVADVVVVQKKK